MAVVNKQDWEEWVKSFNAPAGVPGALPAGPGTDVLSGANRANIAQLFNPQFGRDEQIMAGAENAIAGGWGAGGFGLNQTNRLLDSERKANFLLGSQLLEPYLQRENAASLQASDQAARLNQIAAEGAQALQRLQLSEAGATARLSTEQSGALQRAVLAGNQAMAQLTLQEAGDTSRQREQIGGNLAQTLLQGALAGKTGGTGGTGGTTARPGTPGNPYTAANPSSPVGATYYGSSTGIAPVQPPTRNVNLFNAPMAYNPAARGGVDTSGSSFGLGSSSIDQLLRKYGLI